MVPQTPFKRAASKRSGTGRNAGKEAAAPSQGSATPHEEINELPVHPWTTQQIFYPVSESRHFTREDASKAFNPRLLAADKRIPHPEMIAEYHERGLLDREKAVLRAEREDSEDQAVARKKAAEEARQEKITTVVPTRRFNFVFKDVRADQTGSDGRRPNESGMARYGIPHEDRKKGMVKIPTRVEA